MILSREVNLQAITTLIRVGRSARERSILLSRTRSTVTVAMISPLLKGGRLEFLKPNVSEDSPTLILPRSRAYMSMIYKVTPNAWKTPLRPVEGTRTVSSSRASTWCEFAKQCSVDSGR
jgi:hypothetical protein